MHNSASVKLFFVNINLFAVMEIPFSHFSIVFSLFFLYTFYISNYERGDFMAWQEKCIKALSDQNLFKDSSFHLEEDAQRGAVLQLPLVSRILSLIKSAPLSPHMASARLCHDRYNWKLVLVLSSLLLPQTDHMLLYSR